MGTSFLSAEEFDEQAHRLYESGEYDEALEVLREGLRHHADSALLHVGLGYVRIAREEYAWARVSFETAPDIHATFGYLTERIIREMNWMPQRIKLPSSLLYIRTFRICDQNHHLVHHVIIEHVIVNM